MMFPSSAMWLAKGDVDSMSGADRLRMLNSVLAGGAYMAIRVEAG